VITKDVRVNQGPFFQSPIMRTEFMTNDSKLDYVTNLKGGLLLLQFELMQSPLGILILSSITHYLSLLISFFHSVRESKKMKPVTKQKLT
jgi:hypothetical protein